MCQKHETTETTANICEYCGVDDPANYSFKTGDNEYTVICEKCEPYFNESYFLCELCNMYHTYNRGYWLNYRFISQCEITCIDCSYNHIVNGYMWLSDLSSIGSSHFPVLTESQATTDLENNGFVPVHTEKIHSDLRYIDLIHELISRFTVDTKIAITAAGINGDIYTFWIKG